MKILYLLCFANLLHGYSSFCQAVKSRPVDEYIPGNGQNNTTPASRPRNNITSSTASMPPPQPVGGGSGQALYYKRAADLYRQYAGLTKCPERRNAYLQHAAWNDCMVARLNGAKINCTEPAVSANIPCPVDEAGGPNNITGGKSGPVPPGSMLPGIPQPGNSFATDALGVISDIANNKNNGLSTEDAVIVSGLNLLDQKIDNPALNMLFKLGKFAINSTAQEKNAQKIQAERAEYERQQEIALETARAKQLQEEYEQGFKKLENYFQTTRLPIGDISADEIYYWVLGITEKAILVPEKPITVHKTINNKWPEIELIKNYSHLVGAISYESVEKKVFGFFTDRLAAENAMTDLLKIIPETGRDIKFTSLTIDESEINKLIRERNVLAQKFEKKHDRELFAESIRSGLPKYRYPKFTDSLSIVYFFVFNYENNLDGIKYWISTPIAVSKFSDGTWPLRNDFENQLQKEVKAFPLSTNLLVGFTTLPEAERLIAQLRSKLAGQTIHSIEIKIAKSMVDKPILTGDFWKN